MTRPKTILDLFQVHETRMLKLGKPAEVKNMQTVLLRFTVPGWSGPTPKNPKRSTKKDVEAGMDFLGQLPIEKLREGNIAQERVFNTTFTIAKQRNNARYYLKKLIVLAEVEGWLKEELVKAPELIQLKLAGGKKVLPVPKLTNRDKKPKYTLGSQPEDFINPRLQQQIDGWEKWYLSRKLGKRTWQNDLVFLKQFFGWFVRYELASEWQGLHGDERTAKFRIILDSFCFETMIPFIPLPKRSSFATRSEYLEAREDAKDIRIEEAEQAIKLIKRFLNFYSENYNTREFLIEVAMSVTRYVYNDHIDESNLETIPPILLKLKSLRKAGSRDGKNAPRVVSIDKKFIDYEEVLRVVVKLKQLTDQTERAKFRSKTKLHTEPRAPVSVAWACSRFLIIALLSLLPPDRQQLIRDLEIGKSFAKGCFGRGDIFIPECEMDDPGQAGWCINLTHYKTHATYGDCKITLPNYPFGDGTTLYDYLDLWLNHYRPILEPKGNWLFVRHKKGDQWQGTDLCAMIVKVFNRYAGKPVNPHMLRHIFNTFLEEKNVPKDVKTASRKLMKQSDKIAETVYNHAITDRVVAPAIEYLHGLILETFQNSSEPSKAD